MQSQITPQKRHVALPLAMMVGLYWLSSVPGMPMPDDPHIYRIFYWVSPSLQNVLHIPAYAGLSFAWYWALRAWKVPYRATMITACVIAIAYGLLDEFHQSFVPGRLASLTDVILNTAGGVLGVWVASRGNRSAGERAG